MRGRLPFVWTRVAHTVFRVMFDWEWRAYLQDRCSVNKELARRLGQDVRGK